MSNNDYFREMDPGLEESIATILWSAPRLSMDIPEFKEVSYCINNRIT